MKDNLMFAAGDVKEFYKCSYTLEKTVEYDLKDHTGVWMEPKDRPNFPFSDVEFVAHLDVMKEHLAEKFSEFCRRRVCGRYYIKRVEAAALLREFWRQEKKEVEKIQAYQDSRPDLYD